MRYIDQDEIYRATQQGLSIFEYYFPNADLRNPKKSFKIRKEEKTASARINLYNGYYRITDFGNQSKVNGMKAIDYVIFEESLDYYDALKFIESVIIRREMGSGEFQKPQYRASYSHREMGPDDKKKEYNFTYKDKPSKTDLEAIGRYITPEILDVFHCRVVEFYEYCSYSKKLKKDVVHKFTATDDYPMFIFDYGDFKKLYKPHDPEKKNRFIYVGNKPKDYLYGLDRLLDCDNEFVPDKDDKPTTPEEKPNARVKDLFRCSGESDAMNLASLGFHVYWLNSESASYGEGQFKQLKELCENHYQIMDLDATGKKMAIEKGLKHIDMYTVVLPNWLLFKKDFRGNPCKDLKDYINLSGKNEDQTSISFTVLKRRAKPMKFWQKSIDKSKNKVNYNINLEYYYWFLQSCGFYSMDSNYHKKAGYCYARIEGKVVELIHPDNIKKIIKRFTKEFVRSKNLMDEIPILNKINSSNQISEANLQELEETSLEFKNHTESTEILNFKNGSLRVTKDKIERINHTDLPNYILGSLNLTNRKEDAISHVVDRNIRVMDKPAIEVKATEAYQNLLNKYDVAVSDNERNSINAEITLLPETERYTIIENDKSYIFTNFLKDLSKLHWRKELELNQELTDQEKKEEELSLINLMFLLGYHCAQYKDPSKPWMSFLQDMKMSEVGQSSGRSGKSLVSQGITFVRSSFYVGGRKLNEKQNYQFIYDGLTEFHDFIEIDDFHEFGDFDFFYTQITGKREVNPKNLAPFTLNYALSGKMLMSSNFELQNTNNSTIARLLNSGVSDYYHQSTSKNDYKETRDPKSKYGKRLYDDFTEEEWVKFYNFIAYCIQLQMRFDKIQPPMDNLERRQLRREMAKGLGREEEFLTWAQGYFSNAPLNDEGEFSPENSQGYFNRYFVREYAFEDFKTTLNETQRRTYKSAQFKKHVIAYAEYYGFQFNPADMCVNKTEPEAKKRRIIQKVDGKTQECFFISTKRQEENHTPESESKEEETTDNLPF